MLIGDHIDETPAPRGHLDVDNARVGGIAGPGDQARLLEPVDPQGQPAGGHEGLFGQLSGGEPVVGNRPTQAGQNVETRIGDLVPLERLRDAGLVDEEAAMEPAEHPQGRNIELRSGDGPVRDDDIHSVHSAERTAGRRLRFYRTWVLRAPAAESDGTGGCLAMTGPIPLPIVLLGYGPVAQNYASVLRSRREELRSRYGVDAHVVAIRARDRQIRTPDGGQPPDRDRWAARTPVAELLSATAPAVVAQAVPSHPGGAAEALADGLAALAAGAHLVTATKSPLLTGWPELHAAAHRYGRDIRISGATGAALPAGDLARAGLRGFEVDEVRGCMNGTASFVLDRLGEGMTPDAALEIARHRGIAEADATADLSGADAATKIRLLAGLLWGWDVAGCRVDVEPITTGTAARAVRASARGAVLRQIAAARAGDPGLVVVELREFPRTAVPFGALTGPEKTVQFRCGVAGDITVSGGRSSPLGAALSMVKDTLALALEAVPGPGRARPLPVVE